MLLKLVNIFTAQICLWLLLVSSSPEGCSGFHVGTTGVSCRMKKVLSYTTSLQMGMFDFKPFHGSGSASDNELDEQWRVQQEKLAERRGHLDKAHLKEKYKGGEGTFEIHAKPSVQSHMDDMYIEDNTSSHQQQENKKKGFKLKFPWEK